MIIAILTYHDEDNYGALLQAYATYKAILELGHTPQIIDFRLHNNQQFFKYILLRLKRYRFNRFRKKHFLCKTVKYTSLDELRKFPPVADVYLMGSDQIWNPMISKECALAYFADFGSPLTTRISYASSFGTSLWIDTPYANKEYVKDLLSRFKKILVRESSAVKICLNDFSLNATQVIDPVLLFESYPEITGKIKACPKKMIVYKLIYDEYFYSLAKKFAKDYNYSITSIGSIRMINGIKCHYPERIEKWVSYFASSEIIFTDSFHGTVLSILYNKNFVVYVGDKKLVTRITSLLEMCGLTDRIVDGSIKYDQLLCIIKKPIDYIKVNKILSEQRQKSLLLLKQAIE